MFLTRVIMALRAAKTDDDAAPSAWGPGLRLERGFPVTSGRFFKGAADLYVSAGSAGDLVARDPANRVFSGAIKPHFSAAGGRGKVK